MLDLRALQLFVAVAERMSVSRAAHAMHISQSALSRQIQALEAQLGVRLFDRIGKRLALSAEGVDLLPRAAALLDQARDLSGRVRAMSGGEVGLLRIGATPQTIEALLSHVLVGLRQKYPAIETSLLEGPNDQLLALVESGEAHVAIAALPEQHDFEHQELFMGRLYAIAPPEYDLPRGDSVDIRALAALPLLLLRKGFMTRSLFDRACLQAGIRVRSVLESASTQTLFALANAGHGVAVVSSTAISHTRADKLVGLTLDGRPLGQMISAVWSRSRYKSSVLNPFLRELTAYIDHAPGARTLRAPVPRADAATSPSRSRPSGGRRRPGSPRPGA